MTSFYDNTIPDAGTFLKEERKGLLKKAKLNERTYCLDIDTGNLNVFTIVKDKMNCPLFKYEVIVTRSCLEDFTAHQIEKLLEDGIK